MTRKDFLSAGLMGSLGALAALTNSRCSGSTTPNPPTTQKTFTSTNVSAHTHTVTIQNAEVSNPPVAGITKTTSAGGGHTHTFTLSQAQLQTVNGGGSVTVQDSVTDLHQHGYTITKWF
jgi:hypothetical protein